MNTLEVTVDKVLKFERIVTERNLGFRVQVIADCYGTKKSRYLWFTSLKEAQEVKEGYIIGYE